MLSRSHVMKIERSVFGATAVPAHLRVVARMKLVHAEESITRSTPDLTG